MTSQPDPARRWRELLERLQELDAGESEMAEYAKSQIERWDLGNAMFRREAFAGDGG